MAGRLRGVCSRLQVDGLVEIAPACVMIGRVLGGFPLLHRGFSALFASNYFDNSVRTIGADVVPDDGIAIIGVVACQRESDLSASKRNCRQGEGPKKRCGTDHRTPAMLRATRTIGNRLGEHALFCLPRFGEKVGRWAARTGGPIQRSRRTLLPAGRSRFAKPVYFEPLASAAPVQHCRVACVRSSTSKPARSGATP